MAGKGGPEERWEVGRVVYGERGVVDHLSRQTWDAFGVAPRVCV